MGSTSIIQPGSIPETKIEELPSLQASRTCEVGDEDIKNNTVADNNRNSDQPERGLSVKDFLNRLIEEVEKKV